MPLDDIDRQVKTGGAERGAEHDGHDDRRTEQADEPYHRHARDVIS